MQIKSLIRYPIDIRRARQLLADKPCAPPNLSERPICLDLRTPQLLFDCGRHLASFAHYARSAGSPFFVRCAPLLLAGIARKIHGREMLAESHACWLPPASPLPPNALVLCDYEPLAETASNVQPAIAGDRQVQMMIGRDIDRSIPVMPYPMHPATLRHQSEASDLSRLRESFPRRGIFFAGNQKPKYGDAKVGTNFGVLSRLEIVRVLREQFPTRMATSMQNTTSLECTSGAAAIILSDSRVDSIPASQWLSRLAQAQFFVCCPGSSQPMCHNLIEAMSVGTIPLIEYGDRITPPLRDGENAICFAGQAGLVDAIKRIDQLSADELTQLRRGAAQFYDDYLCGTRFFAALRDGGFDLSARRICMPFHEQNFYPSSRAIAA